MGAEFSGIFVFDAHEQVHAPLFSLHLFIEGLPALGVFLLFDLHIGQQYLLPERPHIT